MIALSVSGLSLSFGADDILKDVSFAVNDGERVGIIGVNGAGKSSLFKLICGEYEPTGGAIYIQKGHTVGMLSQNPDLTALPPYLTMLEYMYTAFDELISLENKISAVENELACERAQERILSLSNTLNELNRDFAKMGGLEYKGRCKSTLLRLGFSESQINQRISTLSGGQYTRLALARLLASEPDILMLDEPTNHLDIDALEWLEGFIATYKKRVLIISHDRYFLDRTTTKTLHIQYTRARLYNGNYSSTKEMQEKEAADIEHRYKEQQKEIAKIRANIEFQRRCNREHNFVTIRSKEKQLERMEKIELAPKAPRDIRMRFAEEDECAGTVLEVKGLGYSYNTEPLIKNLTLKIKKGERVLFLGKNGSGKSTLMRIFNKGILPNEGKFEFGYNVTIGYYDQENRNLNLKNTIFDELREEYPNKTDLELRSALALFLFDKDDIQRTISTLSGGERARVTLAKLILKKVNVLILDEPTNHLDIGSCEALENALMAFSGTIIAVSHDRYFINRIADRIVELDATKEKGCTDYPLEDYDDAFYEYMRIRAAKAESVSVAEEKTASESKQDYEKRKAMQRDKRNEEKRKERAEKKIAELESEIEALDKELFTTAQFDYVRAAEIEERKSEIESELLELYELVM